MINPEEHPLFSEEFEVIDEKPDVKPKMQLSDKEAQVLKENQEEKETISKRFETERNYWKKRVSDLSKRIKKFDGLAELQVDVYSSKQELIEYYHYLQSIIFKKLQEYRKVYKKWYSYYTTGYDLKFNKEENKKIFIDSEMESILEIKNELENHLKFIERTMNNVESIAFGIKHRITIEELKRTL